ncbi:solute carrier organic anion transporter family member 1B1-like [Sceloporus undulatus]|uniref:solute carrier organic anion transporter family member 1B1-like n=1 Tax=Sceloporus undulatus TaxID=8520 RepID=UPI001C4BDB3B|nr:solute carrier organic anion transporter family member 1B1-like [Sceloporus undulatus]XP_042323633.1 solute carrier organic anion transporter family member 1B1-like [Sceloporus undulatus]
MTVADNELENMHKSIMEKKAETQTMEDETDQKLPVKTKASCCKGLKAFLAALAFTYFSKVFSGAMMKSSFTQLERRFGISSSTAGFMDGGFEMGNLLVIAFVSYFGAKFHRPKVIALGCFVMSLGSVLTAMPHFFMGYYRYDTSPRTPDNSSSSVSPCLANQTTLGLQRRPGSDCDETVTSYAWIFVLLGNLLRGIGETPITPLGISYLDDFSREEDTPFYVGILHTIAMIGPMAGFLLGSVLARIYVDVGFVDLGTITITPTDSRWVGAWWLGFLAAAVTNLLSGIPFLFLPKSLEKEVGNAPGTKKLDSVKMKDHNNESHKQLSETQKEVGNPSNLKGFFKSLKRVLGNGRYFTLLCISLLQFNSFIGYLTYNTKYMEQQYGQPASKSNLVTGVAILPAVCIGIFTGGLIMKKYKLNVIAATKMAFTTSFLAFAISLFYMTVGCDNRTVAGLTVSYDGQPITRDAILLSSQCNSDCHCATNQWNPVCGDNGLTYVSACFAGCKDITGSRKETVFHNCSCIESMDSVVINSSAVLGECPRSDDCSRKFIYFTAIKVASSFFYALGGTSFFMIMIRNIEPELKSLAVGLHMLVMRALGGIPAPAYFGAVIDKACLKWANTGCRRQGACRLYDSTVYRYSFFGLVFALRAPSYLLGLVFFYLVKKHFERQNADAAENGMKEGVALNGEMKPNDSERTASPHEADMDTCI